MVVCLKGVKVYREVWGALEEAVSLGSRLGGVLENVRACFRIAL